jgi:hypothetical protein
MIKDVPVCLLPASILFTRKKLTTQNKLAREELVNILSEVSWREFD